NGTKEGTAQERSLALLRQMIVLALEGRRPEPNGLPRAVRAPIPLHASRIVNTLLDTKTGYRDLNELRSAFEQTRHEPTQVTPLQQVVKFGIFISFIILGYFVPVGVLFAYAVRTRRLDATFMPVLGYVLNYCILFLAVFWILWAILTRGGISRRLMG